MDDVLRLRPSLEELTEFVDLDLLTASVEEAASYFPEEIAAVIPTFGIGGDGVILQTLLAVSDNYICEIRVDASARQAHDFDFVRRASVFNLRVVLNNHDLVVDDQVVDSYEIATVTLVHPCGVVTQLEYAGSQRHSWMDKVRKAFPVEDLLHVQSSANAAVKLVP